jgi:hypothetical protein
MPLEVFKVSQRDFFYFIKQILKLLEHNKFMNKEYSKFLTMQKEMSSLAGGGVNNQL